MKPAPFRMTPLIRDRHLSAAVGRDVYLKAECLQVTGSFKVRGAAFRLMALTDEERERGVVACSSGNHGRAVAYVAQRMDIPATVFVPEWVDGTKLAGIEAAGAETHRAGATFDESEALAVAYAEETGRPYVSAYDDPWVIRGQGTLAPEIVGQLEGHAPAAVVAPLSGGGLIGGMAQTFQRMSTPSPTVVAASADRAAVMLASVRAGHPVELPEEETLANALAGGIGLDNRHSFALVRDLVDEHVEVTEEEIASAMRYAVERLRLVVEGGGAVGLAALLSGRWRPPSVPDAGPVVIVLSGGNVALDALAGVLASTGDGAGVGETA